jgi:hypothetical protein
MRRKIHGMKSTDASHNRRRLFITLVGIPGILIVDPFHPAILSRAFLHVTSRALEAKVLGTPRAVHRSERIGFNSFIRASNLRKCIWISSNSGTA